MRGLTKPFYLFKHGSDLWHLELHKTFCFLQMHLLVLHWTFDFSQLHFLKPCPPNVETFPANSRNDNSICGTESVNIVSAF
jgi:hypothetical protein